MSKTAIRFSFDGDNYTALASAGESPIQAVTRSFARRVQHTGNVALTWSERATGGDTYTAKWFDDDAEVFMESPVTVWHFARPAD